MPRPGALSARRLVTLLVAASTPLVSTDAAFGADTVLDPGPVAVSPSRVEPAVGGGRGWLVWGHRDDDGRVALLASRAGSPPQRLPVPPLRRLDAIDVGPGPGGAPAAVYRACRGSRCGVFRLSLERGREARVTVPLPPGCALGAIAIDRRVVLSTSSRTVRCRSGIYEVRRGRPRLLHDLRSSSAYALDVDGGNLAFARIDSRDRVAVLARRRNSSRMYVVERSYAGVGYHLAWDAGRLWIGGAENADYGHGGGATRVRFGRAPRCDHERRVFSDHNADPPLGGWAFAAGRIFYTAPGPTGSFSLRQRTDPPVRFRTTPC